MAEESRGVEPRYALRLHRRARKGLSELTGNRRDAALEFLHSIAPFTPKERIPGKTKKLRGAYERAGVLQYDLPDGYRIQYRVIDESMTVFVDYIGPHPK